MARKRLRDGRSNEAWLGAVLTGVQAASSIIGGILNKKKEKEAARQKQQQENAQQMQQQVQNQILAEQQNLNAQQQFDELSNVQFARGGGLRLRNAPVVEDGGVAIPLSDGTFFLRGRKHSKGGIDIANADVEVEDGEVWEPARDGARVFSAHKMLNGKSPAELVLAGANKDAVFAAQQRKNNNKHIGKKLAKGDYIRSLYIPTGGLDNYILGTRPINLNTVIANRADGWTDYNWRNEDNSNPRRSAADRFGLSLTGGDWVGLATDLIGSIGGGILNHKAAKDLEKYAPSAPVLFRAGKLVTDVNDTAQLAELDRNLLRNNNYIDRNTASSAAARERKLALGIDTALAKNRIREASANTRTGLINQDVLNQQQVANQNAQLINDWQNRRNQYLAGIQQMKNNAWSGTLQGIHGAANNLLENGSERYQRENEMINYAIGAHPGNVRMMLKYGQHPNRVYRNLNYYLRNIGG